MIGANKQILFNFYIEPEKHKQLSDAANQQNLTMAHITRNAVNTYLDWFNEEMDEVRKVKASVRQNKDDNFFGGIFTNE